MNKARIAVMVSGGGTNLQALIDAQVSGIIKTYIGLYVLVFKKIKTAVEVKLRNFVHVFFFAFAIIKFKIQRCRGRRLIKISCSNIPISFFKLIARFRFNPCIGSIKIQ